MEGNLRGSLRDIESARCSENGKGGEGKGGGSPEG